MRIFIEILSIVFSLLRFIYAFWRGWGKFRGDRYQTLGPAFPFGESLSLRVQPPLQQVRAIYSRRADPVPFDMVPRIFYRKFDNCVVRLRNTVLGQSLVAVRYGGSPRGGFRKTGKLSKFAKLSFTSHGKI